MPDATRDKLVRAGRELFARRGYKGASIRAITTRARANLGAVTYHFGSKEALYHAVLEHITAPMRERLRRPVDYERKALPQIEEYIRATFEFVRRNPDIPKFVIQVLVAERNKLPPAVRETIRLNLMRIARLIAMGQQQREIRPGRPLYLALAIAGQPVLHGIYRNALRDAMRFDPFGRQYRNFVNDLVKFVVAGLKRGKR